jgi:hypothetical protein
LELIAIPKRDNTKIFYSWSIAEGRGRGDAETVYLVRRSVLSLSFVEPNTWIKEPT